jgi:hypothetical protein
MYPYLFSVAILAIRRGRIDRSHGFQRQIASARLMICRARGPSVLNTAETVMSEVREILIEGHTCRTQEDRSPPESSSEGVQP